MFKQGTGTISANVKIPAQANIRDESACHSRLRGLKDAYLSKSYVKSAL